MENNNQKCIEDVIDNITMLVIESVKTITQPEQVVVCFNNMSNSSKEKGKTYYQAFLMFYTDSNNTLQPFCSDGIVGEGDSYYKAAEQLYSTLEDRFNSIERDTVILERLKEEVDTITRKKNEFEKKLNHKMSEFLVKRTCCDSLPKTDGY